MTMPDFVYLASDLETHAAMLKKLLPRSWASSSRVPRHRTISSCAAAIRQPNYLHTLAGNSNYG